LLSFLLDYKNSLFAITKMKQLFLPAQIQF
jgi:hypothetical protein